MLSVKYDIRMKRLTKHLQVLMPIKILIGFFIYLSLNYCPLSVSEVNKNNDTPDTWRNTFEFDY